MEARELRIGNWARYVKGVAFYGGDETEVGYRDLENSEIFEPIPLTEEWLLKFGFENVSLGEWRKGLILIDNEYADKGEWSVMEADHCLSVDMKHVHKLQNLYYALTSEELLIQSK